MPTFVELAAQFEALQSQEAQALKAYEAIKAERLSVANAMKRELGIETARPSKPLNRNNDAPEIRAWAQSKGMEVNERGRIPEAIVKAFHADRAGTAPAPTPEPKIPAAEEEPTSEAPAASSAPAPRPSRARGKSTVKAG